MDEWLTVSPQFYKIYQLGEVVGFSFLFMAIDMVGALFSILSLLFRQKLDIPAVVRYYPPLKLASPTLDSCLTPKGSL